MLSDDARCGYVKLARKSGEFADALAVVVTDPQRRYSRIVSGAANGAPLVLEDTSRLVGEGGRDADALRGAIGRDLDRASDRHFDEFQRNLHAVAAMRAVKQVLA